MTDSPLFSAVARFLRHLGVERQLSPITLLNYQRQLDALIALADEAGLKKLVAVRCRSGAKLCGA